MNQIKGAREARLNLTRGERDPEYREACVRDYVLEHKGEVIKMSDFARVAYGTSTQGAASALIKKLIKRGRLTRHKVVDGKRGRSYRYEWHNPRPEEWYKNGKPKVTTRPMTPEEREAAGLPPLEALSSTSSTPLNLESIEGQVEEIMPNLSDQDRKVVRTLLNKYIKAKGMNNAFMMASSQQTITVNINHTGEKEQ